MSADEFSPAFSTAFDEATQTQPGDDLEWLIDYEAKIVNDLDNDLPDGVTVAAEMDVDSIDDLPLVTVYVNSAEQRSNGVGLWRVFATISVFDAHSDQGWEVCELVYAAMHAWSDPDPASVPVHVVSVDDASVFTRIPRGEMQAKHITQWVGSFDLTFRTTHANAARRSALTR